MILVGYQRRHDALHTTRIYQVYYRQPDVYDSVWKWTLKWKREFIQLSKFIFNMGSLEMYDRNTKSVQILLFPPPKSWTLLIMIIFLFCYGVLMKLCFYLKNHNQLSKYIFFLTCLTFYRKTVIVELLHNTQTCLQYTSTTFIINPQLLKIIKL